MSYASDLRRLKRAAAAHSQRSKAGRLVCTVCSSSPAPMTRFGPRCPKHRPLPCERCGSDEHHSSTHDVVAEGRS